MKYDKTGITKWCQQYISKLLDTDANSIDPLADFDRLGLDSALAVSLLIEIEEHYGVELPPEELFENPTIDAVSDYIFQNSQEKVI